MDAKGTSPVLLSNYSPTAAVGWTASAIGDVCSIWSGLRFPNEANWPESPPKLNIHLLIKDQNLVFCPCIYMLAVTKQTQSPETARKQWTLVEIFCYLLVCMLIRSILKSQVCVCWWVKRAPWLKYVWAAVKIKDATNADRNPGISYSYLWPSNVDDHPLEE